MIETRDLWVRFGPVAAVRGLSFRAEAGGWTALIGPNGAGKTSALRALAGLAAYDGEVLLDGRDVRRLGRRAVARLVAFVPQKPETPAALTVAEYVLLGRTPHIPYLGGEGRRDHEAAARALHRLELESFAERPLGSLSGGELQRAVLARALAQEAPVLLLDEPTTALGPAAVAKLQALVLEQAREGVAIVYVSHRLPEVLSVADRVTVLRDGVAQGTFEAKSVSEDGLVALMIGRPLEVAFPERPAPGAEAEVALAVSGLYGERFGPIDLVVRKGEIVGLAGAEGNGQVQFLRALAGIERASGDASCDGRDLDRRSPLGPLRAGVVLLSGDRRGEALFPILSVRANATVQVLRRLARFGIVSRWRERSAIAPLARRLRVRMASAEQPIVSLSGGNQQKVSLMRPFLRGDVKVILAEEPTQGVDVGARFDIYEALRSKTQEGVAALVKSSDPIELAGLCDRVVVISRGRIVEEIPGAELGERRIVEAIVGSRSTRSEGSVA
jgi:ribose transport system ATP-binding protein